MTIRKNHNATKLVGDNCCGIEKSLSPINSSLSAKMNTSLSPLPLLPTPVVHHHHHQSSLPSIHFDQSIPPQFCALPGQHQHGKSLSDQHWEDIINLVELERDESMGQLRQAGSVQWKQPLDPYIDAVQVRHRSSPGRRGERVKAASLVRPQQQHLNRKHLHQPSSSYLKPKKSYHGHKKHSSRDSDSDDSDSDDDYDEHKGKVKKIYVEKVVEKAPKSHNYGHHHLGGHGYGFKGRGKAHHYIKLSGGGTRGGGYKSHGKYGGKRMRPKHYKTKGGPNKKVTYAYIYQSKPVKVQKTSGGHYEHHKHHEENHYSYHSNSHGSHKGGGGGGKHHYGPNKHHGHPMDKGKFNVGGLLGYTLLCVNYLLLMHQQPSKMMDGHYNKYSGYDKYSHQSGPVILAHCGELPAPIIKQHHPHGPSKYRHKSSGGDDQVTVVKLVTGASQLVTTNSSSPLNKDSGSNNGTVAASSSNGFTAIQGYLDRLLLLPPTSYSDSELELAQVVAGGSPPRRLRIFDDQERPDRIRLTTRGGGGLVLLGPSRSSPQVVRSRNHLVRVNERQVPISVRVRHRNRLVGRPRPMNLIEAQLGPIQLALQAPPGLLTRTTSQDEPMQNDQPEVGEDRENKPTRRNDTSLATLNRNELEREQQQSPIVDLPELALAGDSIELSCSHKLPLSRLYSVKWFKDSLEFYRFIPANGPRTKSALFLPDVRLDLGRSNSEVLYLRNVSHRSSGLYRCEAVSEGPNFETVSGEKRMQVYALPETGPQLGLLDANELSLTTTTSLALNQLSQEEPEELGTMPVDGPIVRCSSSRSSPAAQLRLLVNGRPLEGTRALENSTLAYSDGLEANVVSFKLRLSDFLHQDQQPADESANLSTAAAESQPLSSKPKNDVATTTTTTTTTRKPRADKGDANANVHFDADFKLARMPRELEAPAKLHAISRQLPPAADKTGPRKRTEGGANINIDRQGSEWKSDPEQGRRWFQANQARERRQLGNSSSSSTSNVGPQQRRLYSNYIRIKCTSLVPAVGYETASELAAPLTLLVPAQQLSDAERRPGGAQAAPNQLANGARPIRNGGALQAPRAVLIDRQAQASAPPAARAPAPTSPPPSTPPAANNNSSSSSHNNATGARPQRPRARNGERERQLEQRSKYLDELSKATNSGRQRNTRPASNGSSSATFNLLQFILPLLAANWLTRGGCPKPLPASYGT